MSKSVGPRDVLVSVLRHWPTRLEDIDAALEKLRPSLSADFQRADLANIANGSFDTVSAPLVVKDQAFLVVTDASDPEPPNLARLERLGERWVLAAFKFQCATCFGTGLDGTEPCNVCGATGWGLAEHD